MIDGQPIACFQPFIDTATGLIAGVEALGRMRQADGQLLSVGPLFVDPKIPPATLRRLDRQIRDDALARLPEAPADWFLSLNISPRWISRLRPNQPLPSLKQLQQHGVDPHRVVFEITELGGGNQRLPEVVARYREAGARIAIDDFGAGYSQLDRVLALQPDILKLDMRLFQQAARGGPSGEVVKALAQMAEKTGCWIIAEGVETEAELDFALECGARFVQGYLFARPALDFPASDAYLDAFGQWRDRYVQRKLSERARLVQLRQQLAELVANLRPWAEGGARLASLPTPDGFPRLLRVYQCDRHGTQISPNLEWNGLFWKEDRRYVGHNWSWRPYFYQLLAEGWEERRLTLSNTYRDATSNQYCMTAGQFIDQGRRLLLIDIDAEGL
ncbi:EAL domain-containing protein [Pseudomonas sp. R3.Fl]|uniref:EAL domain-containing protein n=1 Tax=Pseudomonas TaxID=286 RepID=UPI000731B11D|nr:MULTISPECIES: EAL domain-containing protein [Pseudomonas]KSW23105.1 diguanylate phosphodiesterase [Pseudomonas sp. ADP]MCL6691967.1 EAL domain-containing protein [Pseudomonas sp. R3.Fl]MCP1606973.1 EAL domain-containing protein (putative c-di-GMP-specific phosphodiesterase class I) [Pseudomonas citronellolis]MCP1644066.1 EAL domain-containing protein (putative c-di-GMP-specific phosphodiesterase class I) [Pseudomonas citronellolis]MCP1653507.1 EAL domain-containing protein (putative c-di-GM